MKKYFEIMGGVGTVFEKYTGFSEVLSALIPHKPVQDEWFTTFINSDDFRQYLHAGEHKFIETDLSAYEYNQAEPFLNHSKAFGEMLDKGYQVLVYLPQFDLLVPPTGSLRTIETMPWSLSNAFANAPRKIWRVKDDVAGFSRCIIDWL
ncbi:unnamed protein product [Allacma fusca]|uniref:Uncharacterized protein n=1 Tax=Allacma fusca TaxID=39272 RepID=A0A8J2NVU7_9HEXA|nr:unnamed protein product [Allacma fusca]